MQQYLSVQLSLGLAQNEQLRADQVRSGFYREVETSFRGPLPTEGSPNCYFIDVWSAIKTRTNARVREILQLGVPALGEIGRKRAQASLILAVALSAASLGKKLSTAGRWQTTRAGNSLER